jgi:hypothetical protein
MEVAVNAAKVVGALGVVLALQLVTHSAVVESQKEWTSDKRFWNAESKRSRIEIVTLRNLDDFLHVIDPLSERIPGEANLGAMSSYIGFDTSHHYAVVPTLDGLLLFRISRRSISDAHLLDALENARGRTTMNFPLECFTDELRLVHALPLDKALIQLRDDAEE